LISWKVFEITKDPFSIGLIGIFEFFPAFFMAFYSGYIIDHNDKKKLLASSIFANLLLTIGFAFITSHFAGAHFQKNTILYGIYMIAFGTGIARAFSGPTSFALLGGLVPKEELSNAITWHSGIWQISSVGGPALAGILFSLIGMEISFRIMVGMMFVAVIASLFISSKPPILIEKKEKMLKSIREGFRFVWNTKELLGALSLDLFAVFFGGATAMLPYFSDVILKSGPTGLGILRSAPALGAVVVYILINFIPINKHQGKRMLICVAGFGLTIIAFGLSTYFWLSVFVLFLSGILDGVSMLVRSTILQLKTPENMKGRVSALNSIFVMSSNELGAFESGFMSRIVGVIPSVVFGGCMTVGIVIYTWIKIPAVKKIEY
jgi:MFS family permease